jgi:Flp pilus assembly protein TadD
MGLVKKLFGRRYRVLAGCAGLLLAGCQTAPADRMLDSYVLNAARSAEAAHDHGTAAARYASLIDAAHPDPALVIAQARNLRRSGQAAEAVASLDNALNRLGPRADLLIELGKQHVADGKPERAIDPLLQAARLAPADWEAEHVLGIASDRMGRHDEARAHYEKAAGLSPDNARVLNNLALSRAMAGDLETGLQLLERAAALPAAPAQVQANLQLIARIKAAEAAEAPR